MYNTMQGTAKFLFNWKGEYLKLNASIEVPVNKHLLH